MAQRLVRTIDENAKEEYTPTPQELARVNLSSQDVNSMKFFRGKPTTDNHQTGYKGRTAIHEILEVSNDMRQLIYEGASQNEIKDLAIKNGMSSLREAWIEKVKTGISTIDEVLRATVEDTQWLNSAISLDQIKALERLETSQLKITMML